MVDYKHWAKTFAKKQGYKLVEGRNNQVYEYINDNDKEPNIYEDYKDYANHYINKGRKLNYAIQRFKHLRK